MQFENRQENIGERVLYLSGRSKRGANKNKESEEAFCETIVRERALLPWYKGGGNEPKVTLSPLLRVTMAELAARSLHDQKVVGLNPAGSKKKSLI